MAGDAGPNKRGGGGGGSGAGGNGFKGLGLSEPIYRAIVRMGFRMPTPVQRKALPVVLTGSDACVMARTGSGKTIAFLIPLLEQLIKTNVTTINASSHSSSRQGSSCRAVIISPTRELSLQTLKVLNKLAHFTDFKAIGIHGGEGMEHQFDMLASKPDIIVATPGRLAHHLSEIPDFNLSQCLVCVLDEADRLMEMGFSAQIRQIARTMPEHCQKVMLSATMPKVLVEFTKTGFCTDPHVVRLDQECSVSEDLRIAFMTCRSSEKDAALLHIMHQIQADLEKNASLRTGLTMVFAATRHHVEYIQCLLETSGISSTLIYGTLDQEARKSNLSAFRTRKKNVLVVTDVAARGIDCPLVDHVIHYNFPPDAKLFVHRSGRAARAGRIGFCWGLVDPEELPYMIDLHLFLGRHPTNAEDDKNTPSLSYDLNEMTPEMVHYGSLPKSILTREVETVQRLVSSEFTGSLQAEALKSLMRVCNNAMKQYRRTRPEASKDAVRRAKAIMEGTRLETGQRVGTSTIPVHPLLRAMEQKMYQDDKDANNLHSLDNFHDHQSFLEEIAAFRPKETVFEAFATGVGKDAGVASQVDRGRTTSAKKGNSAVALTAMRNMRRQMKTVRNKGDSLVIAGSATANKLNGGVDDIDESQVAELVDSPENDVHEGRQETEPKSEKKARKDNSTDTDTMRKPKKFLSKAERRRQKKKAQSSKTAAANVHSAAEEPKKPLKGSDFRDPSFYIENDFTSNPEEAQRARQVEAALQPSASLKGIVGSAYRLEEAMLDVVGDENEELVQKQRMIRWDKSKRKYVQTTVGSELSRESKSKKIRLESGELKKTDKMKLGELYTKWQKRTNRSVGRNGVFDDGPDTGDFATGERPKTAKGKKGKGAKVDKKDSSKSAVDIKKERAKKQDLKLKNMKKGDRRKMQQQQKGEAKKITNATGPKRRKGK